MQGEKQPIDLKIALIGNPNVGKSVLFGFLTGRYASVANYPGTTVEISQGILSLDHKEILLTDTPGINTLVPMSEEEEVTRNVLLKEGVAGVIQVADSKNLRRTLLITLQLAEMGLPLLLDLNMEDEAVALGISIDKKRLESLLGIPIVGTIAVQKKGLKELKKRVLEFTPSSYQVGYAPEIEEAILRIEKLLPSFPISKRSVALAILSGDANLIQWLGEKLPLTSRQQIDQIRNTLATHQGNSIAYRINKQRHKAVDELFALVFRKEPSRERGWASIMGRYSMHPLWGIFILMGVLFFFYEFVGNFGAQIAVDWLENGLFANYLNPWATVLFSKIFFFSPFFKDLFVGEYGIITMALTYALAIIFPIVVTFFIAFGLLEDSGYLPRLSVMLNRIFRWMGLNGKAVVPMVLGLGCDTMATMTTRILDTRKEKIILTLLLALGVPCSAQMGIVLAMLAALPLWATLWWSGVVVGIILLVGFLSSKILPGPRADFVMEIPPIRRPTFLNILTKTLARLEWYLKEVVPLFIIGTLVLFFLDKLHLLPKIQKLADPLVVKMLNLPTEATEAFLIGFLRRDYGATHFFDLFEKGRIDSIQTTIALIVMTLFVPCLANTLMIVKERGMKIATAIVAFIYPFAFFIGFLVDRALRL